MSMITELVKRLEIEADGYKGYRSKRATRVKHLLREAAETIEQLAAKVRIENNDGWIPITYRPMTEEEKKDYAERTGYDIEDLDTILDCPLPEDEETVLITDRLGNVEADTFINDCDECYFECNCDMEDVKAWMSLPEPYREDGDTNETDD